MRREEVRERIRQVMSRHLQAEPGRSSAETLRLDSVALLELIVGIEEEFGISLADEELSAPELFTDLEGVTQLVCQKLANNPK